MGGSHRKLISLVFVGATFTACASTEPESDERPAAVEEPAPVSAPAEPSDQPPPKPPPAVEVPPAPEPVEFAKTQPCVVTVAVRDPKVRIEMFEIGAIQVAGRGQIFKFPADKPYVFTYDDRGAVLNDGYFSYRHGRANKATRTDPLGKKSKVTFDEDGRIIRAGKARYTYDAIGREIRYTKGRRFTDRTYADDGTYVASNNYPNEDEVCEHDLFVVTRNVHGQRLTEQYGGCEINESPRTLTYKYDHAGRPIHIDIELAHDVDIDGSVDLTVDVSYACHD